jgi:flagellar hook assembly protein FlgD
VDWDGKDDSGSEVSSGIYLYRIATEEFSEAKKMLLLK